MAIPKQDLTISYGAFTISNSNKTSYILNELDWSTDYSRLEATIRFKVIVVGDNETELNARSSALEEAYRGRRDTLAISVKGESYRTFSSTNKEVVSTIILLDDEFFTSKTRRYQVAIVADLDPPDGEIRTIQSIVLSYAPNRVRTIRIVIDYHSTNSNSAKDNYEGDTAIWGTLLTTWAGGSTKWWLPEETVDGDIDLGNKLTVTRTYTEKIKKAEVDYGGFSVGGSSTTYDLVNGWDFQAGITEATVSFDVRVSSSSASDLASDCNDLEEAFRKRQQSLELIYDGVSQKDFSGDNIYLNAKPSATAQNNEWFGTKQPGTTTGEAYPYTRDYQVSIMIDMPPNDDTDGRIEEETQISEDPSGILTVTLGASYHSLEGSDSKTLMDADFEDYSELVRARTGITLWKQITSDTNELPIDVSGSIVSVKRTKRAVFRELVYSGAPGIGSITADANIKDFKLDFSVSKKFPGDTPLSLISDEIIGSTVVSEKRTSEISYLNTLDRFKDIIVFFSYNYTKTAPDVIANYYQDTVRPSIITYFQDMLFRTTGTGVFAIVDEDVQYNEANERTVSGRLVIQSAAGFSVYGTVTAELNEDFGKIITNIYDGNPHSKVSQQGEAERRRTIKGDMTISIGGGGASMNLKKIAPPSPTQGPGWETLSYNEVQRPILFGSQVNEEESFAAIQFSFSEIQVWIEPPAFGVFTSGSQ